jgi:hypothetical protein
MLDVLDGQPMLFDVFDVAARIVIPDDLPPHAVALAHR